MAEQPPIAEQPPTRDASTEPAADPATDPATDPAGDLGLALRLADIADGLTMARFLAADLDVTTKPDLSPVTDADREVERVIRAALAEHRPADSVLGEEDGGRLSGRTWVVDPIDGTKNYLRGVPVWATLIGLLDASSVTVGVVSAPALGRRWWAATGAGSWTTFAGSRPHDPTSRRARPCRVSAVPTLRDAFVSYSSLSGWPRPGGIDALLARAWRTRGFGDFWSYMLVAEGACDVATEPELALHDMAALVPIVTEAGGRFSDLGGRDGPFGAGALASNGLLHDEALGILGG